MSLHDRAAAALVAQLSLAADGAILGVGAAYLACRCIWKFTVTSSALRKIRQAPYVQPSDLRSLLFDDSDSIGREKLVILRGIVEVKSAVTKENGSGFSGSNASTMLISQETGDKGVILQRTQTCIYNEWSRALGWRTNFRALLGSWKLQQPPSIRMVPFVLVEEGKWPQSDHVMVNMEGSTHPLPLTTVYHNLQPISASPYTFLQSCLGFECPLALLDEEKILLVGKDIVAVGLCNSKNGVLEIKSCKDLPYFLSDLTKDEILEDLAFKSKVLMWSGVIFGALAVGIIGYSITRNWMRWKARRAQQQSSETSSDSMTVEEEESEDISDGELCVICLMRRRRSAFIPCGHLVCCQRCALSVERAVSPKCPVCRQPIRSSVRVYDS